MKKILYTVVSLALLVSLMAGCGPSTTKPSEQSPTPSQEVSPSPSAPSTEPVQGTTETFKKDGLELEISGVYGLRSGSQIMDDFKEQDYIIYSCYPDAKISVLDAAMSDDNGQKRAQWGFDLASGEKLALTDGMDDISVTEDVLGIYGLDSGDYVLAFEMYDETAPTTPPGEDGPISADYATDEVLSRYLSFEEFVGTEDEYAQRAVITTDEVVTDFRYIDISAENRNDELCFVENEVLFTAPELTPERPFVAWVSFPGTFATRGVTFVDESDTMRCYCFAMSGRDGSLLVMELAIAEEGVYTLRDTE